MTSEQMAWGLAGVLSSALMAFVWREITRKDGIEATVKGNREFHENEIKSTRKEFTESLDRIAGQFRASIDAVNSTLGTLSQTIGRLDATMAREYASKDDLKEVKDDFDERLHTFREDVKERFASCKESCPQSCGN